MVSKERGRVGGREGGWERGREGRKETDIKSITYLHRHSKRGREASELSMAAACSQTETN